MGNEIGHHHAASPLFTAMQAHTGSASLRGGKKELRRFAKLGEGSMRACIFAFIAVTLGVNPFFMPRIVSRLGFMVGFAAICAMGAVMLFLMKVMVKVRDEVCRHTYGGVIEKEYGKVTIRQLAQYLTEMLILAYSLAQMSFYQFCLSKLAGSFLAPYFEADWWLCESAIIVINVLLVLPCSMYIHRMTKLKYILYIPVICSLCLVFLMMFRAPNYIEVSKYRQENFKIANLSIVSWEALAELLLAFDCSRFLLVITDEVTSYSYKRINKILNRAYALNLVVYLIIGCLGYVVFLNKLPNWMLVDETLEPIVDYGTGTLRGLCALSLLILLPLNVIPARISLLHLMSGTRITHDIQRFNLATVIIVIISVCCSVFWSEMLYYFCSFALVTILACCLPSKFHSAFIYHNLPYKQEGHVALLSFLFMILTLVSLIGLYSLVEISSKGMT